MLRADRELLARMARMNKSLAQCALPLANHGLGPDELRALGNELVSIGRILLDRANIGVIDGELSLSGVAVNPPERAIPGGNWNPTAVE